MQEIKRRTFLAAASVAGATVVGGRPAAGATARRLTRVDTLPTHVTRPWLAPEYWANRLQDWRLADGRIESLTAVNGGQTVGVLTRTVAAGDGAGALSVRTGTLVVGPGFSGFLVGAGAGALDWRAAAIVMAPSGRGGGLLATYDSDGNVRFRDHTDELDQLAYTELAATGRVGPAPVRTVTDDVLLQLELLPRGGGLFDLRLSARRYSDDALLSEATRAGVPDSQLVGGISLISTARSGGTTARHWFRELATTGPKIAVQDRAAGPVLGTLYSLSGSVLKLSAQFMPIGTADPQQATLETRTPGTTAWTAVQSVSIGAGYAAVFRVEGWDADRDWQFRVSWARGTPQESAYEGTVRRDPKDASRLTVASVCCTVHSFRNLDLPSSGAPKLPGERFLGLYTQANLYFPYQRLVANLTKHRPDILVALGDQYYQSRPTVTDGSHALLDMLSRWYLWLWSFGELTRRTPTICLVDDHDVYHPNLWGWSGAPAPGGDFRYGGYLMPPDWVNTVQRVQCAHNPDPYDPTPVQQGITVYYAAFSYGGTSFAILEDRKFKNTNQFGHDPAGRPLRGRRQLLGRRQESFLAAWATMHPGQPKVCFTQGPLACVQTDPRGRPVRDPDSGGSPPHGRRTALVLLRAAHALLVSGDQHTASLIHHGIDTFTDGPFQFTPPAAGAAWQRWFEPATALPHSSGPHTGNYTDGYGNRFRVLAVANPKISYAAVHRVQRHRNDVGDQNLKREGYGVVRIDKATHAYHLECWPWQVDPSAPDAAQFRGWPRTIAFRNA